MIAEVHIDIIIDILVQKLGHKSLRLLLPLGCYNLFADFSSHGVALLYHFVSD